MRIWDALKHIWDGFTKLMPKRTFFEILYGRFHFILYQHLRTKTCIDRMLCWQFTFVGHFSNSSHWISILVYSIDDEGLCVYYKYSIRSNIGVVSIPFVLLLLLIHIKIVFLLPFIAVFLVRRIRFFRSEILHSNSF